MSLFFGVFFVFFHFFIFGRNFTREFHSRCSTLPVLKASSLSMPGAMWVDRLFCLH